MTVWKQGLSTTSSPESISRHPLSALSSLCPRTAVRTIPPPDTPKPSLTCCCGCAILSKEALIAALSRTRLRWFRSQRSHFLHRVEDILTLTHSSPSSSLLSCILNSSTSERLKLPQSELFVTYFFLLSMTFPVLSGNPCIVRINIYNENIYSTEV